MTYFTKFPRLAHTIDTGTTFKIVSDILRRISVNKEVRENYSMIEEYQVKDGETPETVSFKFYNDAQYHWVILLINDIIDPRYDWPLTETQLFDYVNTKYSGNISGVKYFTISSEDDTVVEPTQIKISKTATPVYTGNTITSVTVTSTNTYPYVNAYAITNLAYESKLNEQKRGIKVLRPRFLSAFVTEFEARLNG